MRIGGIEAGLRAVPGLQPDRSRLVTGGGLNRTRGEPGWKRVDRESSLNEAMQAVLVRAPESTAVPPEHVVAQLGVCGRYVVEAVGRLIPLQDPVRDQHPDVAGGIARYGAREHRGQAVLGGVGVELATVITREAAPFSAEPQVIVVAVERSQAARPNAGRIVLVEDGELYPIEADSAVQRR